MKYRTLALLLAGLMLTGCAAQTAGTPVPTTAQTTTAPTITTTLPIATTTAGAIDTDAPITPETTPLVPATSSVDTPTTTDTSAATDKIVVTTAANAPVTTIDTPVTTDTPVTDAPITTTDRPVTTTKTPVVTTKKPTTTPKPITTTKAKPITTPKPVTTTAKPVTTTTAPTTTAPHTHSYGAWTLNSDYETETRTCSCGNVQTQVHYATPEDARLIADRVIYYVNKYRAEEGTVTATKLDRLTLVAEMRSEQLTTNFAHDTAALRECAAYYKYGEHRIEEETRLDLETFEVIYTGNILDYYRAPVGEAINASYGYSYYLQTIDAIAKRTADSFHNSPGHWRYVGGTSPYIAVGMAYCASNEYEGVTYDNNWFCALFTCSTTEYE